MTGNVLSPRKKVFVHMASSSSSDSLSWASTGVGVIEYTVPRHNVDDPLPIAVLWGAPFEHSHELRRGISPGLMDRVAELRDQAPAASKDKRTNTLDFLGFLYQTLMTLYG